MANKRHRRRRRRGSRALRVALILLAAIAFVAVVAGASAWYLWNRSSVLNTESMFVPKQKTDIGEPDAAPTPTPKLETEAAAWAPETYDMFDNGTYYRLRENVVAVLFMGIDSKKNEATDSEIVNGTDQADTLLLGIFDTARGSVRVLHIPRDTEADVKVLDMTKKYVGTQRMHLCLQHAYGDGGALSCELMTDAVSSLLFGAPVNRYVSLGTNGVVKGVNAIGGVELTMLEDLTRYSPAMRKGATVKLNGQRALAYIQSRENMKGDKTEANRRARQVQFLKAYIAKVKRMADENPMIVVAVYDAVKTYLQTNLTLEELLFLANQGLNVGLTDDNLISLPGTVGNEPQPFFHMDEKAARALVIELFYEAIPSGA